MGKQPAGADGLLSAVASWTTDWPHPLITTRMPNDGELTDFIVDTCNEAELEAVMVKNPARLFDFP